MKNTMEHTALEAWSTRLPRGLKAGSDWFPLIPFGVYKKQQFMRPEANEVVNYFYSLRGRISRLFRGLPITMHDGKTCGRIVKLKVQDGALMALVKWNEIGESLLKKKTSGWITPIWTFRSKQHDVFTTSKLQGANFVHSPTPVPFPTFTMNGKPLNTKAITDILKGQQEPTNNNRDRFLTLVYNHMKKTGQHYLQSWNTIKQKNPDLWTQ